MIERFDPETDLSLNRGYEAFRNHHLNIYREARHFLDRITLQHMLAGNQRTRFTIVDADSGMGYGHSFLASFGNYTGLDCSAEAIAQSLQRRPEGRFIQADLESWHTFRFLPWPESLDVFCSFETAEHLRDPDLFIIRVRNKLAKSKSPHRYFLFSAPTSLTRDFDPYHLHDRTSVEWRQSLLKRGFKILNEKCFPVSMSFGQFARITKTTLAQKLRVLNFCAFRPRYGFNRLWNWIILNRFQWTSHFYACQYVER
jgi:SAM-dependent methyltransferase